MNTDTFFETSSHKWIKPIQNDPIAQHLIIAGGSVFRYVMNCDDGVHDVDAYILTQESNAMSMKSLARDVIMRCIELLHPEHIIATRTTITLYKSNEDAPFQIVMQLNFNINEILHSFDLVNSRIALIGKTGWNLYVSAEAEHALNLGNLDHEPYIGVVKNIVSARTPSRIRKYADIMKTNHIQFGNWDAMYLTDDMMKQYIEMRERFQNVEDYTYYSAFELVKQLENYMIHGGDVPEKDAIPDDCLVAGSMFGRIHSDYQLRNAQEFCQRLDKWNGFRLKRNWWMYQHLTDEQKKHIQDDLVNDNFNVLS